MQKVSILIGGKDNIKNQIIVICQDSNSVKVFLGLFLPPHFNQLIFVALDSNKPIILKTKHMNTLAEIDFPALIKAKKAHGGYFPSPSFWADQVLYFLLVDRFSDGNETSANLFQPADMGNAIGNDEDAQHWRHAGGSWCGGNFKGLMDKIPYLKSLGVTAVWISPIFKQIKNSNSYHGYGIQDFLETDLDHFGTKEEFKTLVEIAHLHGIYILMDIILNHAGDVFGYELDRYLTYDANSQQSYFDPRWDDQPYQFKGFYDQHRQITQHIASKEDGVWPAEFQSPNLFSRKGRIVNWENYKEYTEGDFFDLKDINLGNDNLYDFEPSPGLLALCEVYKFWIAYADVDGFRIDTVKHMGRAATRFFTSVIHEFTQSIGKDRFFLIGEITGGRSNAIETVEVTGLNAALGIDDVQDKLEFMVKGFRDPVEYFSLFRNSLDLGKDSHTWFNDKIITMIDDHDQVRKGGGQKARFAANGGNAFQLCVIGTNLTTMGAPCLYYGTEQSLDGHGNSDEYLRECMFGGEFGAFRSRGKHCFDPHNWVFQETAKIATLRQSLLPLRRGRQYLRQISGNGSDFGLPAMVGNEIRSIVAWSRIFASEEVICAFNNDYNQVLSAWVTVDRTLNKPGDTYVCAYSTQNQEIGTVKTKVEARNGAAIQLQVAAKGFVIYVKV